MLYSFDNLVLNLSINFFCSSSLINNSSFLSSLISKCSSYFFLVAKPFTTNCNKVLDSWYLISSSFSSSVFIPSFSITVFIPIFSYFLANKPRTNSELSLSSVFVASSIGIYFSVLSLSSIISFLIISPIIHISSINFFCFLLSSIFFIL